MRRVPKLDKAHLSGMHWCVDKGSEGAQQQRCPCAHSSSALPHSATHRPCLAFQACSCPPTVATASRSVAKWLPGMSSAGRVPRGRHPIKPVLLSLHAGYLPLVLRVWNVGAKWRCSVAAAATGLRPDCGHLQIAHDTYWQRSCLKVQDIADVVAGPSPSMRIV